MNFTCQIWEPGASYPTEAGFLTEQAESYLTTCDGEVFLDWEKHFPSEKSLAGVMSRTVLRKFEEPGFAIEKDRSKSYGVIRAFHHRSSTSDLFVEMFKGFNHSGTDSFLVITQSAKFKSKFLYDSATMTIDSLTKDYSRFVNALNLVKVPRQFFLTFTDLTFSSDILQKGKKQYVVLSN
jgi:hypothetical protein